MSRFLKSYPTRLNITSIVEYIRLFKEFKQKLIKRAFAWPRQYRYPFFFYSNSKCNRTGIDNYISFFENWSHSIADKKISLVVSEKDEGRGKWRISHFTREMDVIHIRPIGSILSAGKHVPCSMALFDRFQPSP